VALRPDSGSWSSFTERRSRPHVYHHLTWMVTQHINTCYPLKFGTNNFICVYYFNIYCESHI